MKRLVEFPLEDGNTVLVEVDEIFPPAENAPVGSTDAIVTKATHSLESALDKIKPAALALIATLRDFAESPDEIGVEFGLKLSAEAGAFFAAVGAEANYKVTLKWSNPAARRTV